jgi:large subunit ribosomal protein L25
MERVTIEAELRTAGSRDALRTVRQAGLVAGVLYGGKGGTLSLQLASRQLVPVLGVERKHNRLFNLAVKGGETTLALVAEEQWHPLKSTLTHIDFKRVSMDQKIHLPLSIAHTGTPEGVKLQGGVFEVVLHEVNIECLPADVPDELTVDVTPLGLNQSTRVSDLQKLLGDKVRILNEANAVVFHIVSPRAEEPAPGAAAAPAEGAAAEPEVIKKGKGEAEGAEGEAKDAKKK